MPRPPKNPPQTMEEMIQASEASKPAKVYGGRSETLAVNDNRISQLVAGAADGMQNLLDPQKRVPLADTKSIAEITIQYVRACAESASLPTMSGLAKAIGCTRAAIYYFIKEHPEHESAKWFEDFSDTAAEVMMQAALSGTVAPVPAIFIAKARYNWRDAITIEAVPAAPLGAEYSAEEIEKRIVEGVVFDLPEDT